MPVALFWRLYGGNFEHILHLVLAFLLLTKTCNYRLGFSWDPSLLATFLS